MVDVVKTELGTVVIRSRDLREILRVMKPIAKKVIKSILLNLKTDGREWMITNLETAVVVRVESIIGPFSSPILIPLDSLTKFIASGNPMGEVKMTAWTEGTEGPARGYYQPGVEVPMEIHTRSFVSVQVDGTTARFQADDPEEYPVLPSLEDFDGTIGTLGANQDRHRFEDVLARCLPFAATEKTRYAFNGVYLDCRETPRLIATNGKIMSVAKVEGEVQTSAPSVVIPRACVEALIASKAFRLPTKICRESIKATHAVTGVVSATDQTRNLRFQGGILPGKASSKTGAASTLAVEFITRPAEGAYPKWETVCPKSLLPTVRFDLPDEAAVLFRSAAKAILHQRGKDVGPRVDLHSQDPFPMETEAPLGSPVYMTWAPTAEGDTETEIPGACTEGEVSGGLNATQLADSLDALLDCYGADCGPVVLFQVNPNVVEKDRNDGPRILARRADGSVPMVQSDGEFFLVLMPFSGKRGEKR